MSDIKSLKTDAIVLKNYASGESGQVIKVLSENYGKLGLYGKYLKSKKGAQIEIFDKYYLELRKSSNSNLFTIVHKRPISSYSEIRNKLSTLNLASLALESFDNLITESEEDSSADYYNILDKYLTGFEKEMSIKDELQSTYAVLFTLLKISGYLNEELPEKGSKNNLIRIIKAVEDGAEKKLKSANYVFDILDKL